LSHKAGHIHVLLKVHPKPAWVEHLIDVFFKYV
jgi:hypothetical protein